MPEVYNSTTVEFQTRRPSYISTTVAKYALPILSGVSIVIGGIIFLASFLSEDPPSWIALIFGLILVIMGIGIAFFWKFWDKKGRGFTVLKPRVKEYPETGEPIVQAQEEEFINQEGPTDPRILLHPNVL